MISKQDHLLALLKELQKKNPSQKDWKTHVDALDLPFNKDPQEQIAIVIQKIDLKSIKQRPMKDTEGSL